MDKLAAIRAFVHVAKTGSFTAAGAQLMIGPSGITKKVTSLEQLLGVRLLNRTTHGVSMTHEGMLCLERSLRLLEEMDGIEQLVTLRDSAASGHLRIGVPYAMGQVYLTPRLPIFLARNPALTLQLHYSDTVPDLVEESLDLAIRIGPPRDSRVVARLLARSWRVTCATPAYLKSRGEPKNLADLADHNGISLLLNGRRRPWRFTQDGQVQSLRPEGNLLVNSGLALREAVLSGLGVTQCNSILIAPELRSGQLVSILEGAQVASESLYAVYPQNRHQVPRLQAFLLFLQEVFRPYQMPNAVESEASPNTSGYR